MTDVAPQPQAGQMSSDAGSDVPADGDSKVRVFTVTVTPSHENHRPMQPDFLQHILEQTGYQVQVKGGDHPCNCDEGEDQDQGASGG